jgi:hypothetical protein
MTQLDWPMFDHDPGDKHYSSLSPITPENFTTLKRVWTERRRTLWSTGSPRQLTTLRSAGRGESQIAELDACESEL